MEQQVYAWCAAHYHELLVGSYFLARIWVLWRRSRYLNEALERERLRSIDSTNETIRIISTAYASGEPTTLDDLLASAERDWSLRSSEPPSRKTPEQSYNRPVRSSSPPPPRKR